MRYFDEEHLKGTIYDPTSLAYKIANTPRSDHTELKRLAKEVEDAMRIEHEKERRMIIEARDK